MNPIKAQQYDALVEMYAFEEYLKYLGTTREDFFEAIQNATEEEIATIALEFDAFSEELGRSILTEVLGIDEQEN